MKIAQNMIEEMKILEKDQETLNEDATDLFFVQTDEDFEDADVLGISMGSLKKTKRSNRGGGVYLLAGYSKPS